MSGLQLPPQPTPDAYRDPQTKAIDVKAFDKALAAWREVCHELIEAEKANEFWNGPRG